MQAADKRGSHCALEGAAELAPPAAAPRSQCGGAHGTVHTLRAERSQGAQEVVALRTPPAPDLARQDDKAVRSGRKEFGIPSPLVAARRINGDGVHVGRPGERDAIPVQGRDDSDVSAEGVPERRRPVDDEVEPTPVAGRDAPGAVVAASHC